MSNIYSSTAAKIHELKDYIPKIVLEKHFSLDPNLKEKYSKRQIDLYVEDTRYHLRYLAEAIAVNDPKLFNEYMAWAKSFFENLPVTDEEILKNLEIIKNELLLNLPQEMQSIVKEYIDDSITYYNNFNPNVPSFITDKNPLKNEAYEFLNHLIQGNKKPAQDLILKLVEDGIAIKDIYLNIFQVTQKETGRLWQMSKLSVAQEHYITAATQLVMSQLYPYLFTSINKQNRILISCVAGELHEIGPRMVADLFELEGWDSYFLGANTPHNSFITAINQYKPDILALSVTMTFNINALTELIQIIKSQDSFNHIKILVGGHPFLISDKLYKHVGADAYSTDPINAIKIANNLISNN